VISDSDIFHIRRRIAVFWAFIGFHSQARTVIVRYGIACINRQLDGTVFIDIPEELAQDPWFKVVEILPQNWAVIIDVSDSVLVVFYGDTRCVFDELSFASRCEAEDALMRNGFWKYLEDVRSHELIGLPQGAFHFREHPNGPIYSSGRFLR
jgi:hypothetical protein